jgi:hypothetical protein
VRLDLGGRERWWTRTAAWENAELTSSELVLFLEGSDAVGRVKLSPSAFVLESDGRAAFSR